jgi:hypothetical protein
MDTVQKHIYSNQNKFTLQELLEQNIKFKFIFVSYYYCVIMVYIKHISAKDTRIVIDNII